MGMFDTIRWDAALPTDHPKGRVLLVGNGWQEEDLESVPDLDGIDVDK